jgi:hypothetical protein
MLGTALVKSTLFSLETVGIATPVLSFSRTHKMLNSIIASFQYIPDNFQW